DALRCSGPFAIGVAQPRAAVVDIRGPRIVPLRLVQLAVVGVVVDVVLVDVVASRGGRGRRPSAAQVADGCESAVGLIHGGRIRGFYSPDALRAASLSPSDSTFAGASAAFAAAPMPSFARIFCTISFAMSGFCSRNERAFSLP